MWTAMRKHTKTAEVLLSKRADIYLKNKKGTTALSLALKSKALDIAHLITTTHLKCSEGTTAALKNTNSFCTTGSCSQAPSLTFPTKVKAPEPECHHCLNTIKIPIFLSKAPKVDIKIPFTVQDKNYLTWGKGPSGVIELTPPFSPQVTATLSGYYAQEADFIMAGGFVEFKAGSKTPRVIFREEPKKFKYKDVYKGSRIPIQILGDKLYECRESFLISFDTQKVKTPLLFPKGTKILLTIEDNFLGTQFPKY